MYFLLKHEVATRLVPIFFNTQYSLQIKSQKWNLYLSEAGDIRGRDIPILESIWLDKNV